MIGTDVNECRDIYNMFNEWNKKCVLKTSFLKNYLFEWWPSAVTSRLCNKLRSVNLYTLLGLQLCGAPSVHRLKQRISRVCYSLLASFAVFSFICSSHDAWRPTDVVQLPMDNDLQQRRTLVRPEPTRAARRNKNNFNTSHVSFYVFTINFFINDCNSFLLFSKILFSKRDHTKYILLLKYSDIFFLIEDIIICSFKQKIRSDKKKTETKWWTSGEN